MENTSEKEMNPEESFAIISSMIDTAKNKLADDGFHQIFWGWLITFCALTNYVTIQMHFYEGYWVWVILPPLGAIVSTFYGHKEGKAKKVKTYVDTYLHYMIGAFLISLVIILGFMPWHGVKNTYFTLMIIYGFFTFIFGGILNFKPLIFGSLFSFGFACLSVFLSDIDQLLCISGALICSHIIPGHLLRSQYKSQNV